MQRISPKRSAKPRPTKKPIKARPPSLKSQKSPAKSEGFKRDSGAVRESQEPRGKSNGTLNNMFAETEPTANTYEPTKAGEAKSDSRAGAETPLAILDSMEKDRARSDRESGAIRLETAKKILGMADQKTADRTQSAAAMHDKIQAFMLK